MSFFSPSNKINPFVMPAVQGLEGMANDTGLGASGRFSGKLLKQMFKGNYGKLAGTLLSPIHDRYATDLREAIRNNSMGANAFAQGFQPALMSALEQDTRRKMAEQEGLAYGQAIPQLWGQASGAYQNALNQQENVQLGAREAALRGRMGGTYQEPSTWDKITGFARGLGSMAAMI